MADYDVLVQPPSVFDVTAIAQSANSVTVGGSIIVGSGGSAFLGVPVIFGRAGVLQVVSGAGRFPAGYVGTIEGVRMAVATAPTGAAIIADVNKNGTTIFTTQANRPTIAAGGFSSLNAIPDVVNVAAGDLLSVDIDQIGSSVAGSDLTVSVLYVENVIAVPILFSTAGVITVSAGTVRFPTPYAGTILGVRAAVGTAPTGAAILVDVNKNGTTIFTTQGNRPSIAGGGTSSANAIPAVTSFAPGDLLSVDVDQIGSTVAGSNLTVSVLIAPS